MNCGFNQLNSLNVNNNVTLANVFCYYNEITTLNLSNNTALISLNCDNNQLISLNFISNLELTNLSCSNNSLTSLNVSSNTVLTDLVCASNQLTSLDLSSNSALTRLSLKNNQLSNLGISNNTLLTVLVCDSNQITSLDVSTNTLLNVLECSGNQLTNLNVSSNVALTFLACASNHLSSLDITGLNLQSLNFAQNQITSFNFPSQLTLSYFRCSYNNLTQIDVSKITCDNYDFSNNPNLTYINMKNGHQDQCTVLLTIGMDYICSMFLDLPNLQFICVDEGESVGWTIPGNISMSSYCSFTPGGNYNTISGNIKHDSNNNGCDANDLALPNIRVNINDGANTGAAFTNTSGNYTFFTQAGSFDITPDIENPSWFTFSPSTATIPFADNNNNTATQDFCISPNGNHPDLEVVLAPTTVARPGFDAEYVFTYKNKGNQTLSGVVNLLFDDSKTDFISANPAIDNLVVNSLTWNYANLLPFESRSISIVLNVNSPVETPAVNIGDILNFTTSITPVVGDDLPLDNTFIYNQTVVGSFDPNNIECLEGTSVAPSEIGKYLHYVINFENTGNFPAENVIVKTIIDPAKYDINSLQLLDTSNPVDARITGNVVEFIFKNVQLAGPGGHGHVLLKVKSKNSLIAGDNVANRADIFFDYNAPVDTGLETTVFQSLSNSVFAKDDSINVSPNPSTGNITITSNFSVKSIELYDVQGRILQTILNANKLDISEKVKGIYFLKITTEKGSKIEKLVKD